MAGTESNAGESPLSIAQRLVEKAKAAGADQADAVAMTSTNSEGISKNRNAIG